MVRFSGNLRGDPLWGGPCITLSTYACRKRSNSEQERPNSGDTGGAEGVSDEMSSQCAVPLPHTTMGLGECHKARDSRRTRLTASDKLDFLTAPDQGFRHLPSLQAAAAARNVHPGGPHHQGGQHRGLGHPGVQFGGRKRRFLAPKGLLSFREKRMKNIAKEIRLSSDSSRRLRYASNGVQIIICSYLSRSGPYSSNPLGGPDIIV